MLAVYSLVAVHSGCVHLVAVHVAVVVPYTLVK